MFQGWPPGVSSDRRYRAGREVTMSRQQFGFLAGFLAVAVWALAGVGVTALAVLAGLLGWLVVRVLDGDLAVTGLGDRRADARRRR
jgi:hypothetical protein